MHLLLLRLEDPGDILCDFLELGDGERLRPGDKSFLDMELFLLVGERLVLWLLTLSWSFLLGWLFLLLLLLLCFLL